MSVYYKINEADEADKWQIFDQSELTSDERNGLTSKFKIDKNDFAQFWDLRKLLKMALRLK